MNSSAEFYLHIIKILSHFDHEKEIHDHIGRAFLHSTSTVLLPYAVCVSLAHEFINGLLTQSSQRW